MIAWTTKGFLFYLTCCQISYISPIKEFCALYLSLLFLTNSWRNGNILISELKWKNHLLLIQTWRLYSFSMHLAQRISSFPLSIITYIIYAWETFKLIIKFVWKMPVTFIIGCACINCSVCFMSVTRWEMECFPKNLSLSASFWKRIGTSVFPKNRFDFFEA